MSEGAGRFGPWIVQGTLGQGGMGVVYRATDEAGRRAAVKVARIRPASREALQREIEALGQLRHPGIVRILDHGIRDGALWVATELVDGEPLRERVLERHPTSSSSPSTAVLEDGTWPGAALVPAEEPTSWDRPALLRALTAFRRLCDPLAWLHGEGHVHGDVKPENVLVRPDGSVVLVDFGLWRTFDVEGRDVLRVSQRVMGTGAYLAPEQVLGRAPDGRSDLYAVGCMLYELLSGRPPFGHGWAAARLHVLSSVPPLSESCEVPDELAALVAALLQKDPRARLGYATDLAEALEELGVPPSGETPRPRRTLYRPSLVGRHVELALVETSAATVLTGEPGIGKTRLLSHLAEQRDRPVVAGSGSAPDGIAASLLRGLASRAPADEVRGWLAHAPEVLCALQPELSELLGAPGPPPALPAPAARSRAVAAVAQAVRLSAPARVVVDDADRGSELDLALCLELVRRATPDLPVVLAASDAAVVDRLARAGARRVELGPLSDEALDALLREALAADELLPELSRALREQAGGRPRFAWEYATWLVDEGRLVRRHRRWSLTDRDRLGGLEVPQGLAALARRRLEAGGEGARRAARRASVLGLGGVTPEERAVLEGARLVTLDEAGWRWASASFREVAAEGLGDEERRELHALALARLPEGAPALLRADLQAGAGRLDEARGSYEVAAREASDRMDWTTTVTAAERGRALRGSSAEQDASFAVSLAIAARARGRFAEAAAVLEGVVAPPGSELERRVLFQRSRALARCGRAPEAIAALRGAASAASGTPDEARWLEALGETLAEIGDLPGSVEARRRVVGVREALGEARPLAQARVALANALQRQDRWVEASELLDLATPVLRELGPPLWLAHALSTRAAVCASRRAEEELRAAATEAVALVRAIGMVAQEVQILGLVFDSWRRERRAAEALGTLDRMAALAEETGNPRLVAQVAFNRAWLALGLGEPDALERVLACLPALRETSNTSAEGLASGFAASLLRRAGRWEEAAAHLERLEELARLRDDLSMAVEAAGERVHHAVHEGRDGLAEVARLEERLARLPPGALDPEDLAAIDAARGLVGERPRR